MLDTEVQVVRKLAILAAVGLAASVSEAQVRYIPKPRVSFRVQTPRVGVSFGSRGTRVRVSTPGFGYSSGPRGTRLRFSTPGVQVRTSTGRIHHARRTVVRTPRRYVRTHRPRYQQRYVAPRRCAPSRTVIVRPQRTVVVRPQRTVVVRPQHTVVVDPYPNTVVVPARPEPNQITADMTDPNWDPTATHRGFQREVRVGNATTRVAQPIPNTVRVDTGRSTRPRSSVSTGRTRGTTWVSTGRSTRVRHDYETGRSVNPRSGFETARSATLDAPKPRDLARSLLRALERGDGDRACALARWLEVRPELWASVEIAFYSELPSPLMLRSARRDLARDCQGTAGYVTLSRLLGAR